MEFKILKFYISSEERLVMLHQLFERTQIESLLNDYHRLPAGFTINLIDRSFIDHTNREFHTFLRTICWVMIDDGIQNVYPDIYKTAIHHTSWDQLKEFAERELLLVVDKCINIRNLFTGTDNIDFLQIQKPDKSFKLIKSDRVYLFTNIERNTYMFYKSEEGAVKKEVVHNSLSFLENKLHAHKFFRTHKNFLINVNQVNHNSSLDASHIKLGQNLQAKLSKKKQNDFINYLESL